MVAKAVGGEKHSGSCLGCVYKLAPGTGMCHVCGWSYRWREIPYVAGHWRRREWAAEQYVGDQTAKHLLSVLVTFDMPQNKTPGTVRPGVKRLAHMIESTAATVHRALDVLVDKGWIKRKHGHDDNGHRAASHYTITHPYMGAVLPENPDYKIWKSRLKNL